MATKPTTSARATQAASPVQESKPPVTSTPAEQPTTDNPLDLTIPMEDLAPGATETDARTQAIEVLGELLCSTRHYETYWTDGVGGTICAEDLDVATKVCDSDWLAKITAYREQKAAAQVIDQAKANLLNAKPSSAPAESFQVVQEALARSADHLRPIMPDQAEGDPGVSGRPQQPPTTPIAPPGR